MRVAPWWQYKIYEYFPQPSHKQDLGESKLRIQAKDSIAHTTKHALQMVPQHNASCKIHLRHANEKVQQSKLFAQECQVQNYILSTKDSV